MMWFILPKISEHGKLLSLSDPHPYTLFWHSFWHAIWKYLFMAYHILTLSNTLSEYTLTSIWHSFWHLFWHSFCHLFWHSFWHLFRHSFSHSIWHLVWHSIWRSIWHSIWQIFWHSLWHGHCPTEEEGEEKVRKEKATPIKYRDPHPAGGEKSIIIHNNTTSGLSAWLWLGLILFPDPVPPDQLCSSQA